MTEPTTPEGQDRVLCPERDWDSDLVGLSYCILPPGHDGGHDFRYDNTGPVDAASIRPGVSLSELYAALPDAFETQEPFDAEAGLDELHRWIDGGQGEDSERGREVTHQVSLWLQADGDYIEAARYKASRLGLLGLANYVTRILQGAQEHSAPWEVAQDLSPRDYNRINWAQVAQDIAPETNEESDNDRG